MKSYFQVARKYIPDTTESTPVVHTPEYSREITYTENPSLNLSEINGNVYLCVYKDTHLAQHASSTGFDIHFQDLAGEELPFELIGYSNGTGAWWIRVANYQCESNFTDSGSTVRYRYQFSMLYGDSARNTDASTQYIWWDHLDSSHARYLNCPVVIHSNYQPYYGDGAPSGSSDYQSGFPTPYYHYARNSSSVGELRLLNSTFFNGMSADHNVKIHTQPYSIGDSFPKHIGKIEPWYIGTSAYSAYIAADPSITLTNHNRIHSYEEKNLKNNGDIEYFPDPTDSYLIEPSGMFLIGVKANGSLSRANSDENITTEYPSSDYELTHVASFNDLHLFAKGDGYIMFVDGFNSSFDNYMGASTSGNGEPNICLFEFTKTFHTDTETNYKWTTYNITRRDDSSVTSFSQVTKEGHVYANYPGIGLYSAQVKDPNNWLDRYRPDPTTTKIYHTIVTKTEAIHIQYGTYPFMNTATDGSDNSVNRSLFIWNMLFNQDCMRTIGDVQSDATYPRLLLSSIKTYQGLSGGCN